jgi:hypothetical protein
LTTSPLYKKSYKFCKSPDKIHHIGIIVPNEEQVNFLLQLMGFEYGHSVYVKKYQSTCIFLEVEAGDYLINFLSPTMTRGIIIEFVQKKKF